MNVKPIMASREESPKEISLPISVVVCARNSEATIEECLESIRSNQPAEIIVMDGNSTDRTREIAQKYADKVYTSEKGLGYRFQFGTEQAKEDYVAYIDSDVVVPGGTLEVMIDELNTNGYAAIQAQVQGPCISNYWEWARQQDLHLTYNHPGEAKYGITTMTALWRKEIILKYKFDPFFSGGYVDGDISHRIVAAGYKLGCSQAFIYHHHRSNLAKLMQQRYWHGQGCARFIWKHKLFLGLANILCPVGPIHLANCLLSGKPQLIPYVFVCDGCHWAGTVTGLAHLLMNRLSRGNL